MESLNWIWTYIRKYKIRYIIALFFVLITSMLNMVNPFLGGQIVDKIIIGKEKTLLLPILFIMILVVITKGIICYSYQMEFERVSQKVLKTIRGDLYNTLLRLDFNYYNNTKTGDIMARMTGDTDSLRHFISWVIYNIIANVSVFIFALISMMCVSPILTVFMVSVCPIIAYFTRKMSKKISPTFYNVREAYSSLNSVVQENISGNRVVKAFAQEDYEIDKFNKENINYKNKNLETNSIVSKYMPVLEYLAGSLSVVMILIGGVLVINQSITLGDLVVFNGLLWALNNPMRMAGYLINDTQRFIASSIKIRELLNEEPKIKNKDNTTQLKSIRGDIIFNNVSFSYGDNDALKNITFTAKSGQTIGIIGHTGAGKSTLVNLICRFYDATKGKIDIDGIDIRNLEIRNLRQSIGIAMQDVFLFSDTIEGNIAYGAPRATLEDVKNIAAIADADEFIANMPEGYDTIIGERGVGLSGGQRQRIALARALLKNPSILILDDTTSAVDMETEVKIQKEVNSINSNITKFIIAHRISSVKSADLILVLDNGMIVERGTHDSLIKKKGYYYNVYKNQFGNFDMELEKEVM